MKTIAHTDGTWKVKRIKDDLYVESEDASDGEPFICDMQLTEPHNPVVFANANLIASAPELLAALISLVDCPDYRGIKTLEADRARTIIAKARGGA